MYFYNDLHEKNFYILNLKFPGGIQYEASNYIAAFPEIFNAINYKDVDYSMSPLFALTSWNEDEERHEFTAAQLTGTTKQMCELGLSLYNGYPSDLDYLFSVVKCEELIRVIFQAMKIRTVTFKEFAL
ncbi:hypothetical protein [Fictibacillus sp. 26RED30]|uniref:hypothetical protein n=1 Tax=Fictibacillus sp. 26RED30 TaxID=2745877 RepID=UPI0018CEC4B9|nr:hypothetical protein [Fictibacillus sp. 26RED30]MBH0159638.1 hypothetical protein [Fictibacillus sp. 26RED30]